MFLLFSLLTLGKLFFDHDNYFEARNKFIKLEESLIMGSSIVLSSKEEEVNKILMQHKFNEHDAAFKSPKLFIPRRHFFESKEDIENSEVFKLIKKMPKGGVLHGHDSTLASSEYIYELTHEDNLYACSDDSNRLRLKFLENPNTDRTCKWTLIKTLRENSTYDKWVRSQLTLNVTNPHETYPDVNTIWQAMMNIFQIIEPMLAYKPIFQKAFYQALKELYEDNVTYLEFRSILPLLHELNGTYYNYEETVKVFQETINQFTRDYPDFIGARLIYSAIRQTDDSTAKNYLEVVKNLKNKYPDLFVGFDLIGQEDLGRPLSDFIRQLHEIKDITNFYFHSAETNWYGTSSDFNLVDAVLLGTKRIGHGYGLTKHPLVMDEVKKNDIAIEVCPISNQVLMLVEDMRNHPAATLIAEGFPVVISYDNPTCWGTKGLSYDFYMAFMGIASRNSDLKLLKQFAINSMKYSSLMEGEKELAMKMWEKKWNEFINLVISQNN